MVRTGRRRRRIALATKTGSAAAALLVVGLTVGLVAQQRNSSGKPPMPEMQYGGISCSQCASLMAGYQAKQLDTAAAQQVAAHLKQCGSCRQAFQQMNATVHVPDRRSPQTGFLAHFGQGIPRRLAHATQAP